MRVRVIHFFVKNIKLFTSFIKEIGRKSSYTNQY
ncbi:MAG: hypothetical protein MRERV_37c019 [Mycoplasmataceae bacterium RV_VA103A]|nr:MAG: hypothetical protein MRERV_37c019 [Mycoplasmataceae bacterium RV_VA103A]